MPFKMKGPSLYKKSAPLPQRAELSEEDIERMKRKKAIDDIKKESDLKKESIPPATTHVDKDIVEENKPKTKKEGELDDIRDDVKPKKRKKKKKEEVVVPKLEPIKIETDLEEPEIVKVPEVTPESEPKKKKKITKKDKKKLKEEEKKAIEDLENNPYTPPVGN